MRRHSTRYLLAAAALVIAAYFSTLGPPLPRLVQPAAASASEKEQPSPGNYATLIDLEGFHGITPYERIVAGPHDFTLGPSLSAIPLQLGDWKGSDLPITEDIKTFLDPDFALNRLYAKPSGQVVYFSVFGSRGGKTFTIFEHTPAICFPNAGWTSTGQERVAMPVGGSQMYVHQVRAHRGTIGYVAMYWYIWESTDRNAEKGVSSVRIYATDTQGVEAAAAANIEFLQQLFTEVLSWRRP
jgi:hypothetical protein